MKLTSVVLDNNHVHYICGKYVTFHLFFLLHLLYTFSVNDLIENGTESPICFYLNHRRLTPVIISKTSLSLPVT